MRSDQANKLELKDIENKITPNQPLKSTFRTMISTRPARTEISADSKAKTSAMRPMSAHIKSGVTPHKTAAIHFTMKS